MQFDFHERGESAEMQLDPAEHLRLLRDEDILLLLTVRTATALKNTAHEAEEHI
jgi:hypothetical protein